MVYFDIYKIFSFAKRKEVFWLSAILLS